MIMKTQCPKCSKEMEIPDEYVNRSVKCTHCGNQFDATERSSPKVTSGIKKQKTDKKPNSLPVKIGAVVGIVILALFITIFALRPSSPPDAFAKEIESIPAELESEGFAHSFELVDYDITVSDSLVYTHESTMRFISTSKSIEHSVSFASEFRSRFKYNEQTKEWELHSLERVSTEYDFSASEEFSELEKASSAAQGLASKLQPLVDKREALALELLELINKQMEAISAGNTASSEFKERERIQKKNQAEIKNLDVQIEKVETEGESFLATQTDKINDLTERLSAIKELSQLKNFQNVLENTFKEFIPKDESVFKTRYQIDFDEGILNRN